MSPDSATLAPAPPSDTAAAVAPRTAFDQGPPAQEYEPRTLTFANLELRPDEMQALVGGARVGFTVREFQVLAALAARQDRVVRRTEIYRQVWGEEMRHRDRAVDVFVRKVRAKLAAAAPDWTYVHTHFGVGYRFAPEPARQAPAPPNTAEIR